MVDFQVVQLWLANIATEVAAACLLIYPAVWNAAEGLPFIRMRCQ